MNRIKNSFIKIVSSQKAERKIEKSTGKSKSRDFENPHRFASPKVVQVFSEYTPGLGRRIPELSQRGGLFEVKYANNYERRVEWLYSPVAVPFYRSSRQNSDLDSGFYTGSAGGTSTQNSKPEIFTFDEQDICAMSSTVKSPQEAGIDSESKLSNSNQTESYK